MCKCTQGSLLPLYLTNFGALNLGGIMTWGKLVKLSRSTLPWALEPSMIRTFLARVSTWLLTWPIPDSRFLSLEESVSRSLPWGGILWPWPCSGGDWFSFLIWGPLSLWPEEFCPPQTNTCCIICIISAICTFKRAFSSWGEVPLVDISIVRDLVMMGSRCGGSLDCFLLATFRSWEWMGCDKNGLHLTMWKHNTKIELVYILVI